MIRGLYQHLDNHLLELEEKFRSDEMALRNKVDIEIKSQMSKKLKELKYDQTDLYNIDFLYELGKLAMFRVISPQGERYINPQQYKMDKKIGGEANGLWDNICIYEGFYNNISKLNADKLLDEDEYIIGIIGKLNLYNNNSSINIGNVDLKVITNYLNYYEVINQYPYDNSNINKKFNERYQLKTIRKNNMRLFDKQIDIINATFDKIDNQIYYKNGSNNEYTYHIYTHYDIDRYNFIELYIEKDSYSKKIKEYNYQCLPKECCQEDVEHENDEDKFRCCQKCYNELNSKKNNDFYIKQTQLDSKIRNNSNTSITDKDIFTLFSKDGDFSVLRKNRNKDNIIFIILEKFFNDFWEDKIENISNDCVKDISVADIIETKDDSINKLSDENKLLKRRIKTLEKAEKHFKKSSEYEDELKMEIKSFKQNITAIEKKYKKLELDKIEIEKKYNEFKLKLGTLIT